eukprot:3153990-Pleurochrysis_carterae.AAC.1
MIETRFLQVTGHPLGGGCRAHKGSRRPRGRQGCFACSARLLDPPMEEIGRTAGKQQDDKRDKHVHVEGNYCFYNVFAEVTPTNHDTA